MRLPLFALVILIGCGRPDTYEVTTPTEGPWNTGDSVRLTFNPAPDYFAAWTEDGQGILYAYPRFGDRSDDRCLGILPANGGSRIWEMCEDRSTHADSSDSFAAPALSATGQLLFIEASAVRGKEVPDHISLWLADTAHPLDRHLLLRFPTSVGTRSVDWLGDIRWTGTNTFMAIGQTYTPVSQCRFCGPDDSVFLGQTVLTGTINSTGVILTAIPGTGDASSYSIVEGGAALIFVRRWSTTIERVKLSDSSLSVITTLNPELNLHILGLTCRGNDCLIAANRWIDKTTTRIDAQDPPNSQGRTLLLNLTSRATQLRSIGTNVTYMAHPQVSPLGGLVILEIANLNLLADKPQTDLVLYRGVLP